MAGKRMVEMDAGSDDQSAKARPFAADSAMPESAAEALASPMVLPADCRMAGQSSLKFELAARLAESTIELDGRQVERVDTAALQLLVLFRREFVNHGGLIRWLSASGALNEAANLLGLAQLLELPAVALA